MPIYEYQCQKCGNELEALQKISDAPLTDCPECGAEVYEDAERCPSCGSYIILSSSGSVWQGRPAWWIILGLLGIIAVILALVPG